MHEQEAKAKEFVDRFIEMRKNTPDFRRQNDVYIYLYITFALTWWSLMVYLELFVKKN